MMMLGVVADHEGFAQLVQADVSGSGLAEQTFAQSCEMVLPRAVARAHPEAELAVLVGSGQFCIERFHQQPVLWSRAGELTREDPAVVANGLRRDVESDDASHLLDLRHTLRESRQAAEILPQIVDAIRMMERIVSVVHDDPLPVLRRLVQVEGARQVETRKLCKRCESVCRPRVLAGLGHGGRLGDPRARVRIHVVQPPRVPPGIEC